MKTITISELPTVREAEDARLLDMGDGIACLQYRSKGNSVTPGVRDFLLQTVQDGLSDFDGLVIANEGKHFSVGANLASMKDQIEAGNFDHFRERGVQKAVTAMRLSQKPVVAAPFRMTLGGGLEVVLHAHGRVAPPKTFIGLVEVGVGLIPGGGGTKESALLVARAPAKEQPELLKKTFRKLILREVSKDAENAKELAYLSPGDPVVEDIEQLPLAAKDHCLRLIREGFRPPALATATLPGRRGCTLLWNTIDEMLEAGEISPYDAEIGRGLAVVLCGGDSGDDLVRTEEELMQMENDLFVQLTQTKSTYDRISHFLEHNDFLRN